MQPLVLAVASRALLEQAAHAGIDTDEVLAAVGLERAAVFAPDARLPASAADAVWSEVYARCPEPHLALSAAAGLPLGAYKVIDFLAANSPTVGEGLRRIADYFSLVDPRMAIELAGQDPVELRLSAPGQCELPLPAQEYTFAALVVRSRAAVGADWPLLAVELAAPAPPDDSAHRKIFAAQVRWESAQPRLLIPRAAWETPVRCADANLLSVLEDLARRLKAELPRAAPPFVAQLREVIGEQLKAGDPSAAPVARRLGMSERTLQRRLKEEGQSYSGLLDEVRAALARAYLRDPELPLAEVAWLVGFSEQSAFTRAFKRWTGTTPRQWRVRR